VDDPHRFEHSRDVGAYLGLVPRRRQSGRIDARYGISKTGDKLLRRLLVNCGQYILGPFGPESDLRIWGLGLVGSGGKRAKKKAAVAVARRLAVVMHRLWVTGEPYDPLHSRAA
jgi:transposase